MDSVVSELTHFDCQLFLIGMLWLLQLVDNRMLWLVPIYNLTIQSQFDNVLCKHRGLEMNGAELDATKMIKYATKFQDCSIIEHYNESRFCVAHQCSSHSEAKTSCVVVLRHKSLKWCYQDIHFVASVAMFSSKVV